MSKILEYIYDTRGYVREHCLFSTIKRLWLNITTHLLLSDWGYICSSLTTTNGGHAADQNKKEKKCTLKIGCFNHESLKYRIKTAHYKTTIAFSNLRTFCWYFLN